VVAEFVAVESGRKNGRPVLAEAKLDRLARDAEFVLRLSRESEASGLAGFLFADLPVVAATTSAGRLIRSVMVSVAEFESRRISKRTRETMAQASRRGVKFGASRPLVEAATQARRDQANAAAERLMGLLTPKAATGASLRTMGLALEAAGVLTSSGRKRWSQAQVARAVG
jgi:DNA invertase Pin-like site-specific DNA recombinase